MNQQVFNYIYPINNGNHCAINTLLNNQIALNTEVTVNGWLRTRRDSKAGFSFLSVYDGSCFNSLQIIADKNLPNYHKEILRLTTGCSLSVRGTVVSSPGREQAIELIAREVVVHGWVEEPDNYPVSAKKHSLAHLREIAHLRPRTNIMGAVARVRHTLAQAIHHFFDQQGFFWVSTPIITTADCEGAGELFRVSTLDLQHLPYKSCGNIDFEQDFFAQEAFLTVSGQLNAESYATALSKVYTFGPTFRAENSNTSRHLAEFWMVEPEVAFADLNDIAALSEALLKSVVATVLAQREEEINFFTQNIDPTLRKRLETLLQTPVIHIDYTEAISLLQKNKCHFELPIDWGVDLAAEHEKYLTEQHFQAPVIIRNYPKAIKAFYMRLNPGEQTVAAMDLLVPGIGEIIGGSQREERLEILDKRLQELGLNLANYSWYRDLRRYGSVPHAGFGLGFERLVLYVTGMQNVRDVIAFPRTPRNASF